MQPMRCNDDSHANHAKLIIDQLMWRMAAMDRYSDEMGAVTGDLLLPLDVVAVDYGDGHQWYGVIQYGIPTGRNHHKMMVAICTDGSDAVSVAHYSNTIHDKMRTIDETEGAAARVALSRLYDAPMMTKGAVI